MSGEYDMDLDKILKEMMRGEPYDPKKAMITTSKGWWTGWIRPEYLSASAEPKVRPWTCYKMRTRANWIPRTSQKPYNMKFAYHSPEGHLGFEKEGYFFMTKYRNTDLNYETHGDLQGYMDKRSMKEIKRRFFLYDRCVTRKQS